MGRGIERERRAGCSQLGGGGLGLVLGVDRVLGDAYDGLLFLVAGGQSQGQKQAHGQKSSETGARESQIKDSRRPRQLTGARAGWSQRAPGHGARG